MKCYDGDPCLLMLSFGREICDTQLRVAARRVAAILRRKMGSGKGQQRPKRGKRRRAAEKGRTGCLCLERGGMPNIPVLHKSGHSTEVKTILFVPVSAVPREIFVLGSALIPHLFSASGLATQLWKCGVRRVCALHNINITAVRFEYRVAVFCASFGQDGISPPVCIHVKRHSFSAYSHS